MHTKNSSRVGKHQVRELFDRKAQLWSAKYSTGGALTGRIGEFSERLRTLVPPPANVVEFGCGTGELAHALDALGYQVTGCDFSPAMIAQALRTSPPDSGVRFVTLDADWRELPFAASSINAAVASSVFEYLDDPAAVAGEFARILVDGGVLIFNVPNPDHPVRKAEAALASILAHSTGLATRTKRLPKLAEYEVYLEVSRNRWPIARWRAEMAAVGLMPVDLPVSVEGSQRRPRASLILLAFVRSKSGTEEATQVPSRS